MHLTSGLHTRPPVSNAHLSSSCVSLTPPLFGMPLLRHAHLPPHYFRPTPAAFCVVLRTSLSAALHCQLPSSQPLTSSSPKPVHTFPP